MEGRGDSLSGPRCVPPSESHPNNLTLKSQHSRCFQTLTRTSTHARDRTTVPAHSSQRLDTRPVLRPTRAEEQGALARRGRQGERCVESGLVERSVSNIPQSHSRRVRAQRPSCQVVFRSLRLLYLAHSHDWPVQVFILNDLYSAPAIRPFTRRNFILDAQAHAESHDVHPCLSDGPDQHASEQSESTRGLRATSQTEKRYFQTYAY